MTSMLVTCPESAHLEEINFEDHPLGVLIAECSGLPDAEVECPRTCAGRLDQRCRAARDPQARIGTVLLARSCLR